MKKLMALALAVLMVAAICATSVFAADFLDLGTLYEYTAEKYDEILAGEAGEATSTWTVPYLPVLPTLDGTINLNEYAKFEGYEDYIALAVTQNYGADKADALYEQVKNGIFDAYWGWDGQYFYLAFDVDCVDGYDCTPYQNVMLFAYNCLQIGLADVDAQGRDATYTELGFGYNQEKQENVTFTWSGRYLSGADDFTGKYDETTHRVTYELRIDLQQALGWDTYPENGDRCNFAFVLEVQGEKDENKNAQVMFCHGMAGQYADKHTEYFASITFDGKPSGVVIAPPLPPNPSGEVKYGLIEVIDFSMAGVFNTMEGVGVNLAQVTEAEDTFMRVTAAKDGGYVYSTAYPKKILSDAKYVVIKYRTSSQKGQKLGLIWKTRQNPEYDVKSCYTTSIENNGEWKYLLLDMNDESKWQDYILNLGIVPFYGMENVAGEVMDIAWIKAYGMDPYELYAPLFETVPLPETESEESTYLPDTTEPYYEDTIWETFYEPVVPEDTDKNLGGIFFELFGDDVLTGCQGGGCYSVTGGILFVCLLGAAWMFRKKE